jgi:hypothetical protein
MLAASGTESKNATWRVWGIEHRVGGRTECDLLGPKNQTTEVFRHLFEIFIFPPV